MPKKVSSNLEMSEEAKKTFAQRIRLLREEREFSMRELATAIGFSQSGIGMYETGKRSPDLTVILTYADFFGVPVDYLLGKTDVRDPLYQVACFSDISRKDMGRLSKASQNDIKNFIEYVMDKEKKNKKI